MKLITLYARYLANPTDVEANNFLGKVVKDTRPITGDVPSTIAYLPQSGTFRGTVAMVLLVLAAVAFISVSSVVLQGRETKLVVTDDSSICCVQFNIISLSFNDNLKGGNNHGLQDYRCLHRLRRLR